MRKRLIFKQNAPKSCIFSLPAEWCGLRGENFLKKLFAFGFDFHMSPSVQPKKRSETRNTKYFIFY
jgi:hypothetical protein